MTVIIFASLLAQAAALPASAQKVHAFDVSAPAPLEEIVVTAQRRAEKLIREG
jgi:hypothetical protein